MYGRALSDLGRITSNIAENRSLSVVVSNICWKSFMTLVEEEGQELPKTHAS